MNGGGSLGKLGHHSFLNLRRLHHHRLKFSLRHRQVKLVRSFDVSDFLEHIHEFRQVEELCKAGSSPVAGAFRGQFYTGRGLAKGGRPAIEVGQALLLQGAVLQVAHHRVQLGHGVRHRGAGGEDHASAAGDLIHIAALAKHIAGLLSLRGGQTCDITHFCIKEKVFERM